MSNFKQRKPRHLKYSIFIMCEDKNFGYKYLDSLISQERIKVKSAGTKTNILSMVKKCNRIIEYDAIKTIAVNADIFCVFDTDRNTQKQISDAINLTKQNDIKLIMSNPCIEYWFLSHYSKSKAYLTTNEAIDRIKKKFKSYCKECDFSEKEKMLEFLLKLENTNQACSFNKSLYKNNADYLNIENNPSSNMFLLIEKINGGCI